MLLSIQVVDRCAARRQRVGYSCACEDTNFDVLSAPHGEARAENIYHCPNVCKSRGQLPILPKKAFKKILSKLLFDILELEDDYIEISLIIKKTGALDTLVNVLISAFLVFFSCHYALFVSKRCINFT